MARINDLERTNKVDWEIISLKIDFAIPTFHRTIATVDGVIYLIGGTDENTSKKS